MGVDKNSINLKYVFGNFRGLFKAYLRYKITVKRVYWHMFFVLSLIFYTNVWLRFYGRWEEMLVPSHKLQTCLKHQTHQQRVKRTCWCLYFIGNVQNTIRIFKWFIRVWIKDKQNFRLPTNHVGEVLLQFKETNKVGVIYSFPSKSQTTNNNPLLMQNQKVHS